MSGHDFAREAMIFPRMSDEQYSLREHSIRILSNILRYAVSLFIFYLTMHCTGCNSEANQKL